jgi:hypothetical protein
MDPRILPAPLRGRLLRDAVDAKTIFLHVNVLCNNTVHALAIDGCDIKCDKRALMGNY